MDDYDALNRIAPVFTDSYFVVDGDLRIADHNMAFAQLLGVRGADRRKVRGTPCYERLRLEICKNNCIARECFEKNSPVHMNEIRGRTKDGRDVVLELSAIPLRDEQERVTGALVIHRDVTGERRLKERYVEETEKHKKERGSTLR